MIKTLLAHARRNSPLLKFFRAVRKRIYPLFALCLVGSLYLAGALDFLSHEITDLNYRIGKRPASGDLVIVAIDPPSLNALKVWPWPRHYHTAMVDTLSFVGARRVAFHMDFSSATNKADDALFAQSLERARMPVILPRFKQSALTDRTEIGFHDLPLAQFQNFVEIAFVGTVPDDDGLIRNIATHEVASGDRVPSLPIALAGIGDIEDGLFNVDYGIDPHSIPVLSYVDVMKGNFPLEALDGKTVLIGATAAEFGDMLPVPGLKSIPAVYLMGLAYESLTQGRALQPASPWIILLVSAAIALAIGPRFSVWRWQCSAAVAVGLSVLIVVASIAAYLSAPVLVESAPPLLLTVILFVIGLVRRSEQQSLTLIEQGVALQRTNALMRAVVERNFDGIVTVDYTGRIMTANASAANIFGYEPDDLAGKPFNALVPDIDLHSNSAALPIQSGPREIDGRAADGNDIPIEVAISIAEHEHHPVAIVIVRDIADRKEQQEQLRRMALFDSLTGLPNRTLLNDRLANALRAAKRLDQRLGLLLLDLDRFKEVNDTLGHHVGDALLQKISERLQEPLRKSDTIARLGGDEFAILLPHVSDLEMLRRVSARCIEMLEKPFDIGSLSLDVSVSIGMALYPDHAEDAARLLQCADVAMYMAKKGDVRYASYDPGKDNSSVRDLTMVGDLRRAIESDRLSLYYQPQIDLRTNRVYGVEALSRWRHPEYGFIPPDKFITLAERTGLVRLLSRRMIETAFRQLKEWQQENVPLRISLNLSARNLQEPDFARNVAALVAETNIDPSLVTFEITESAIMNDPAHAFETMKVLSAIGIRFSIDDFGTGYSSLSYLKQLPVNELKIDRSFVLPLDNESNDAGIVQAIVDLGRNLGLHTVAEGIENERHLEALRKIGCDTGQGYYFARPMPVRNLEAWLHTSRWGFSQAPRFIFGVKAQTA